MFKPLIFGMLTLTLLGGCQYLQPQPTPQQQAAPRLDLNRRFILIDEMGNAVGTAMFRPLGHGEIRDNNGELVGVIVRPD